MKVPEWAKNDPVLGAFCAIFGSAVIVLVPLAILSPHTLDHDSLEALMRGRGYGMRCDVCQKVKWPARVEPRPQPPPSGRAWEPRDGRIR